MFVPLRDTLYIPSATQILGILISPRLFHRSVEAVLQSPGSALTRIGKFEISMLDTTVNGLASLSSTLLFLTILTIILRFYARRKQNAPLQIDDWMIVAAWVRFL
jgi:hypothetical protein